MFGFLLLLLAVTLLCAWLAPGCALGESAAKALDASVFSMGFERGDLGEIGAASTTAPVRTQEPEPAPAPDGLNRRHPDPLTKATEFIAYQKVETQPTRAFSVFTDTAGTRSTDRF